jgi:hypothetical protein
VKKRKSKSGPRGEAATAVPASYLRDERSPPAQRAVRERALARAEPSTTDPVLDPPAGAGAEAPSNGQAPAADPAAGESTVEQDCNPQHPSLAPQACEGPGEEYKPEAQAKAAPFRADSENSSREPQLAPEPPPPEVSADASPPPVAVPVAVATSAPLAAIVSAPAALPPPQQVPVPSLEERICRLEKALARLQEMRAREGRGEAPPPDAIQSDSPAARPASGRGLLHEMGKRVFGSAGSAPLTPNPSPPRGEGGKTGRRWLLWETIAEARVIVRMILDPRYRLSWSGRIVPLVLLGMIATSWWWVPGTSLLLFGTLLNKAVDLVLAFAFFKVLGQEARRYRETSPDLPPHLRL